jgi:hypothetical protein
LTNSEADSFKTFKMDDGLCISDLMLFAVEGAQHIAVRHTDNDNNDQIRLFKVQTDILEQVGVFKSD